ncbi:serine hydrolase domain-containing protein [Nocardioides albus]|uniref:Beta-lactamase-related domain-containing protein n=1 Tax=Nocardioides albus TaxID=1841 RepID=A0A7W5A7W0_9ACTN|nr:serine hydrolase [Nocardioides albus]MBB3090854.1 hypothetical protein [Nocardioides albus]
MSLENWQTTPMLEWSFQHVEELFPTALIGRGDGPVGDLGPPAADMSMVEVPLADGRTLTVGQIMEATDTDGWAVARHGRLLTEHYPRGMTTSTRHLLMSVSKSLVGSVAGILAGQDVLDPAKPITHYVPALDASGYRDATVRHLLDMRSGIHFSEDYLDPAAEVRVLEQAIGWAPRTLPDTPTTMRGYLTTLRQKAPHGWPFEYRSCETDVLGWVCEAAAGQSMPELMSEVLWSRIGAEDHAVIGVDSVGSGMFDGGICAVLRDLVRFGHLLGNGGAALTGTQVLPEWWVSDTLTGDSDSRAAFAVSPTETLMPGGMYRNQFWFPYPGSDVILCLGIHGQMIYVNRTAGVVAAKVSSWPEPQHAWKLFSTLAAFDAIASAVA